MKDLLTGILHSLPQKRPSLLFHGKARELPPKESYTPLAASARDRITVIDGGSAPILLTPGACILFVRIVTLAMDSMLKKTIGKQEGFVAVTLDNQVIVRFLPLEGAAETLFTLPADEIVKEEQTLLAAGNLARRLLELRAAAAAEGLLVLDGSLEGKNPPERSALERLRTRRLLALSKTTATLSRGSFHAFFANAPGEQWYVPLETAPVWSGFARLAPASRHVFRIDSFSDPSPLLEELALWCEDPLLPGYPYPLVLVDQLARVSEDERAALRTRLAAAAGKEWSRIIEDESALDAHGILDRMRF